MHSTVVYDISAVGWREWPFLIASIAAFLILAIVYGYRKHRGKSLKTVYILTAFTFIFALITCGMTYWDFYRLKQSVVDGTCLQVKGRVDHYWTRVVLKKERDSHRWRRDIYESFQVNGVEFWYYRDFAAAGFRNAGADSIRITNGLPVNICYVTDSLGSHLERRIVRLELSQDKPDWY